MKDLTKEWYEEAQVFHYVLAFPETEEEWRNEIASFEAESMDFPEIRRRQVEDWKAALLRVLPADFHPLVEDGTLVSVYPSEELRTLATELREAFDARTDALRAEYRDYFNAIKRSLPPGAARLHEKSLHDAKILSVEQPAPDRLVMKLDCSGAMYHESDVQLTFTGVRRVEGAFPPPGSYWMTDEVFLAEEGFELHMLFEFPIAEFTLFAKDVEMTSLK